MRCTIDHEQDLAVWRPTILMRSHGTLTKWNDERGFGFVLPSQGTTEIFVHISAFRRSDQRPEVNELISFETEVSPNGKLRAIRVMRAGQRTKPVHHRRATGSLGVGEIFKTILGLVALVAIGAVSYSKFQQKVSVPLGFKTDMTSAVESRSFRETTSAMDSASFRCDGRTMCSQMTSCAEARYFLQHCPNPKMDGDNDGEPCEQQWCN